MESKKSSLASSTPNISPSAQGLTQFQGFWIPTRIAPISSIISFQKYFQALDEDIIVASNPKAGTTWLKALVFTIVNRHSYKLSNTPLNSANPHQLISHFEIKFYKENLNPDLSKIPSPRGEESYGPFWEHALGYWNMSMEKPSNILFMRYEELKEDPVAQTKRLAEFLGFPFSIEEEKTGVVNQIIDFCSFNHLKELEVNKTGKMPRSIIPSNKLFFRSGKVGDYINYLSPTAVELLSNVLKEKLSESSLTFN
ncbi:cytosolic sulfotransferase 14-like [Gossypium arboreum]|uniref:cytosolic sulfotransferase 14-like n=1 Tax=Gossypium arboreum TaxID=29729 RepID=UPI000819315B|nr:cytosolic sulfotransferase 14-like [Gossypium arboreum]